MTAKMVKCFECKEKLDKLNAEKVNISKTDKVMNRYFHEECLSTYYEKKKIEGEKKKDWEKWDGLYQYIKKEIFKYDDNMKLSNHLVNRLLGMRNGQYYPRKNSKVILSKEGYPFEVILMTFKVKKVDILNAIFNNGNFKNEKHKEDYIMAIISNSINDVYLKIKEKEKVEQKMSELDYSKFNTENNKEFVDKANIKENKVASLLNDLW